MSKRVSKNYHFRKFGVPTYIRNALQVLKPPEELTVSEWAEKHRQLDEKSSAIPGGWKNSTTPYLVGIMDEFSNFDTEEIIFVKPTQVGGTEAMQNMLGYIIDQDPSPTMIVYPTDQLGKTTSVNRLQPMFERSPTLRKHYRPRESTDIELQFDNMYISVAGSNSPSALASKPIKFLFCDEIDKYPGATAKEADPYSLAKERTKTFQSSRKIYTCSTPTLSTGKIWQLKTHADEERHYFVPCPHCGEYIEFKFQNLKWPDDESGLEVADRVEYAYYVCQECGGIITDADKVQMNLNGRWQTVSKTGQIAKSVCFWMNTLYSPFTSFAEIARAFINAKKDADELHNFINSWLAEPWEDTALKTNYELVLEKQDGIKEGILPAWTKLLTAGVDVQEKSLFWTIRAWGDYARSHNVAHGQALNFDEIHNIMSTEFATENGDKRLVDLCLIDSGDQTDDVYGFCADETGLEGSEWILPCKGTDTMLNHYKISSVNRPGSRVNGLRLVLVDGGKYKDMIANRIRKPKDHPGSWNVYEGCDEEYAKQVTAEHKVKVKEQNGKPVYKWRLKHSHGDNHYLDAEVYAFCAADILNVRYIHLRAEEPEQTTPQPESQKRGTDEQSSDWITGGGKF